MLGVLLLYVCFTASMFIEGFIVSANHYPLFITGIRILLGGILLLTFSLIKNRTISVRNFKKITKSAFFKNVISLYVISPFLGSWSMQYLDPVKACFIFVLLPFITAIMLFFWYGKTLSKNKIRGLFLGFVAIIPIILESNHGHAQQASESYVVLAYVGYICAVLAFAYGWIVYQHEIESEEFKSETLTSIGLIFGGTITLLMLFFMQGFACIPTQITANFWQMILVFAALTAVGYALYSILLRYYSATFLSFASFLEPALGLLYARFFLGQQLSVLVLAALLLLGIGFYLFYKEELRLG